MRGGRCRPDRVGDASISDGGRRSSADRRSPQRRRRRRASLSSTATRPAKCRCWDGRPHLRGRDPRRLARRPISAAGPTGRPIAAREDGSVCGRNAASNAGSPPAGRGSEGGVSTGRRGGPSAETPHNCAGLLRGRRGRGPAANSRDVGTNGGIRRLRAWKC